MSNYVLVLKIRHVDSTLSTVMITFKRLIQIQISVTVRRADGHTDGMLQKKIENSPSPFELFFFLPNITSR